MERIKTENVSKVFFRYLIPSVTGTLSIGLLIFIDTIFIGRGIGSLGLAALNTVIPAYTLYSSTGLILGIGGATAAAVDGGRGDHRGKNRIFTHSVILALILGILYILGQSIFLEKICYFLGATENTFIFTRDYLGILSKFSLFYIIPHCLNAFIRNDGNPNISMMGMVLCGIVNIILDYLFIFKLDWGMKGAALATGIAQMSYTAVLLSHFISDKNSLKLQKTRIKSQVVRRIIRVGLPSFINEMSFGTVILAFNYVFLSIGGDTAVAAYSIILNINILLYLVFLGISQASQPLFSINHGGGMHQRVSDTLKLGTFSSALVGVAAVVMALVFRYEIIGMFIHDNGEVMEIAAKGMPMFFSGSVFMGINIVMVTFYQSIENSAVSSFLTAMKGFVLAVAGLAILPGLAGIDGVWLTPFFAEGLTFLMSLFFIKKYFDKTGRNTEKALAGAAAFSK